MTVKQKKRRWSDEEKRSICFQTMVAGVSVAQVARRYAMNANLIFKWLRDERYAPELDAAAEEVEPVFLPIEVEAANSPPRCGNHSGRADRDRTSQRVPHISRGRF